MFDNILKMALQWAIASAKPERKTIGKCTALVR